MENYGRHRQGIRQLLAVTVSDMTEFITYLIYKKLNIYIYIYFYSTFDIIAFIIALVSSQKKCRVQPKCGILTCILWKHAWYSYVSFSFYFLPHTGYTKKAMSNKYLISMVSSLTCKLTSKLKKKSMHEYTHRINVPKEAHLKFFTVVPVCYILSGILRYFIISFSYL